LLLKKEKVADAGRVLDSVAHERETLVRDLPQLTWVRPLGQVQQSNLAIYRLREKFTPAFEGEARDFLDAAGATPAVRYNVACLYAQAAALGPAADRDRYSKAAVSYLNEVLEKTDYFRVESNVTHLDGDTDLDPIRNRPDYLSFRVTARARVGLRESAPPPRKVDLK
jgi:hypothetical protein